MQLAAECLVKFCLYTSLSDCQTQRQLLEMQRTAAFGSLCAQQPQEVARVADNDDNYNCNNDYNQDILIIDNRNGNDRASEFDAASGSEEVMCWTVMHQHKLSYSLNPMYISLNLSLLP